ncbi:hypothetical protein MMC12_007094 [Toensbergia leucococca]|nr:hypothetical protein [Toensbergia leucococca]
MPMVYGEGRKAFVRLQEEIMKHSDDQSLFAWTLPSASNDSHYGLLAKEPKYFVNFGGYMPYHDWELTVSFLVSNKGLRIDLHLSPYDKDIYVAALTCLAPPHYDGFLGIFLKRVSADDHQYAKVRPQSLCKVTSRESIVKVYVRNSPPAIGP